MPITLRLAPVSILAIAAAAGTCAAARGQTQDAARAGTAHPRSIAANEVLV